MTGVYSMAVQAVASDPTKRAVAEALVADWMTPHPYTCAVDASLADARDMMAEYRCRRLPVVDDEGRLIGILSLGDVRQAAPSSVSSLSLFEINYFWAKLPVSSAMTPDPITLAPTDTIKAACNKMLAHKISGLPVVVDHKVVGIFTETDALRFLVSLD
ncbi:MAG: CBS domain-containing protein [Chloroflexi bacterium]|nr:CBS domain-containing protein [Chloroflexota bacterium]